MYYCLEIKNVTFLEVFITPIFAAKISIQCKGQ